MVLIMKQPWKAYLLAYSCLVVLLGKHCQATYRTPGCRKSGWFGSECQYKCHCANNYCTIDGKCTYGCEKGWFGPACQYADLTTTYSTTKTPWWLSDGKDNTCNDIYRPTKQPSVTFTQSFPITWLRIRVSRQGYVQNIEAHLRHNWRNVSCSWKSVLIDDRVKDMYCDHHVEADQVTFSGEGVDYLCSVYISGGRNFALKQNTIQSTTYSGGGNASNAVDGNTIGYWSYGSCTHTDGRYANPKWTINFRTPQMINRYVLYNRADSKGVADRLRGFLLRGFNSRNTNVYRHEDKLSRALGVYNIVVASIATVPAVARVTIATRPYENILTICEFEAYGECAQGTYGLDCEERCSQDCNSDGCDVFGDCFSCPAGYMGNKCNRKCQWPKYGMNCQETCSDHCQSRTCDTETGHCKACKAGYTGSKCDQECQWPKYGVNCHETCSDHCQGRTCDTRTGYCATCEAGYTGYKCDEKCESNCAGGCDKGTGKCNYCVNGKWGNKCQQECESSCAGGCDQFTEKCHACVNGKWGSTCQYNCSSNCAGGNCYQNASCYSCKPGYWGITCTWECLPTKHGIGCTSNCSLNCAGSKCDHVTGICIDCPAGKRGDHCDKDCPPSQHGPRCKFNCSNDCLNDQCDGVTGFCVDCPHGKMVSDRCDKVCMNGTHGYNCIETCSNNCGEDGSCHPENGTCVFACKEGYRGAMCTEELQSPEVNFASAGVIIGFFLLLAASAFLIAFVLRSRKRNVPKDDNNPDTSATYVNAAAIARGTSNNASSESSEATARSPEIEPAPLSQAAQSSTATPVQRAACKSAGKLRASAKAFFSLKAKKDTKEEKRGMRGVTLSTSVAVADLGSYLTSKTRGFFITQYNSIPNNDNATTEVGMSEQNRIKNRYKNVCAYDHSRVLLAKDHDNYINASYIEGYKGEEKFIATQGPTQIIMGDFIRMLWEQRVDKVVMLTNLIEEGKAKCDRYWPQHDEMQVEDIKVTLTTTEMFADYTIRRMQLSKRGEAHHDFIQFHYTSWPDKGVPTTPWPLVDFEQRVAATSTNRPIVVHCSAGIGRTGTFIALRNVMREAEDTGYMDFFKTVENMRKDRISMVQTAEQYEFIHRAAHVAIICMGTTITASDIQQRISTLEQKSKSGQSYLEKEFKAIRDACHEDVEEGDKEDTEADENVNNVYQNSRSVTNKMKNRLTNILPKECYRVKLTSETKEMGDYINAVFLPSFRMQDQHILTQLPLPMTVTDFWRMVTQNNVALIVAFQLDLKSTDSTIADYLPQNESEPLKLPLFSLTTGPVTRGDLWEKQKITITPNPISKGKGESATPHMMAGQQKVVHLKCIICNLEPAKLLTLIKQIKTLNPVGDGKTVFMCRNGADYSGLICVLSLLLDRMDNDHRLTVPLAVGAIKAIRPQVIPTLDQYRTMYTVLKEYTETRSVYSNLG